MGRKAVRLDLQLANRHSVLQLVESLCKRALNTRGDPENVAAATDEKSGPNLSPVCMATAIIARDKGRPGSSDFEALLAIGFAGKIVYYYCSRLKTTARFKGFVSWLKHASMYALILIANNRWS